MSSQTVMHFLGALVGGHRPNVNAVSTDTPLPISGGQADNVALTTGGVNGVLTGGILNNTSGGPAAGTAARFGAFILDLARRLVVKPLGSNTSHVAVNIASNGLTGVTLFAGVASQKCDLQSVTFANRDTVSHTCDILDNGVIVETAVVKADESFQFVFPAGRPNAAVNTAWTAVLRAAHTTNPGVFSASGYRTTG